MDWSAYEERLFVDGDSPRERSVNRSRAKFERDIDSDPSHKSNTKIIRNGKVIGAIGVRMDRRKLVNEVPEMEIHDVLNNNVRFRRGDILLVTTIEDDIKKDDYWLCFEEDNFHGIHRNGKVELCNFSLHWQDDDDLSIVEEWCVVSRYKTSSTGKDEGNTVTVDNTRRNILIPYNDRTAKLRQGKRFFIDVQGLNNCKAYELTDLDRTSYIYNGVGCFQLVCSEVARTNNDREDLMVCDYKEPPVMSAPPSGLCNILYSGESTIIANGSPKTFTAVFYDNDNNLLTTIIPTWTLELPTELQSSSKITIVSEIGNEISIEAQSNANIGSEFILKMSAYDSVYGHYTCEQRIQVGGVW